MVHREGFNLNQRSLNINRGAKIHVNLSRLERILKGEVEKEKGNRCSREFHRWKDDGFSWSWSQRERGEESTFVSDIYRWGYHVGLRSTIVHVQEWEFCVTSRNFFERLCAKSTFGRWSMPIEVEQSWRRKIEMKQRYRLPFYALKSRSYSVERG